MHAAFIQGRSICFGSRKRTENKPQLFVCGATHRAKEGHASVLVSHPPSAAHAAKRCPKEEDIVPPGPWTAPHPPPPPKYPPLLIHARQQVPCGCWPAQNWCWCCAKLGKPPLVTVRHSALRPTARDRRGKSLGWIGNNNNNNNWPQNAPRCNQQQALGLAWQGRVLVGVCVLGPCGRAPPHQSSWLVVGSSAEAVGQPGAVTWRSSPSTRYKVLMQLHHHAHLGWARCMARPEWCRPAGAEGRRVQGCVCSSACSAECAHARRAMAAAPPPSLPRRPGLWGRGHVEVVQGRADKEARPAGMCLGSRRQQRGPARSAWAAAGRGSAALQHAQCRGRRHASALRARHAPTPQHAETHCLAG